MVHAPIALMLLLVLLLLFLPLRRVFRLALLYKIREVGIGVRGRHRNRSVRETVYLHV